MILARRSFLTGLVSLIAAPVVVKYSSIMPVRKPLLSLHQITREAVLLFKRTNVFLENIDTQYDDYFANLIIGEQLRIRLPNDFRITT